MQPREQRDPELGDFGLHLQEATWGLVVVRPPTANALACLASLGGASVQDPLAVAVIKSSLMTALHGVSGPAGVDVRRCLALPACLDAPAQAPM